MAGDGQAGSVGIEQIRRAAEAIAGAVHETRQRPSRTLSHILGCEVILKFENRQFTAAFKERGALNKLLHLSAAERAAGVIAMSAGNHAQGVAYHANRLGIPATIVMPKATPNVKVQFTKSHGARVLLEGDSLAEAAAFAHNTAEREGLVFVHPYDDPHVIAGQGTIALEMLGAYPELDTLVVPIGGGGLIAGIATAAKALKPEIEVIGVQSILYPSMKQVLAGEAVTAGGASIAEGIAVKQPGTLTRAIVKRHVDDIVLVEESAIERAIALLINVEKTVVEGAGAAGLAAILSDPDRFRGRRVGTVLCGGNIDQRLLASVLLRDLVRQGRLARLRIRLGDQAGELSRVTGLIGEAGGNIVDVAHQRVFSHLPAKEALIEVAVETRDDAQLAAIVERLSHAGYAVTRLAED
ncbi:threonine ammonia-lyase [Marivibrio halodurans]|uniref:Threonine ammonia-lyase n=1 Tax=Marivibrio halodurans TaxID=2039722 RepID=A0A8J7RZP7_9PROT|nr:threonine ammonia-lyase [Marivibrio halodurans]MBP5856018.1 threonine ammonia-lyase [Marivibrio halodurans]